ncbi:hypothetical protein [Actinacidiphila reveromycinica]|uniref:hypothetical protein n=1 Tax=Actinacidiphila reveromycinica TaxID=659352 RepID=UPI0019212930|nr:hypothetical protein [Streptomyces sp. SN-593]
MVRTCDCGKEFEAKRSSARYCSERCKKRAQRRPGGVEADVKVLPRPADDEGDGALAEVVRAELAAVARAETSAGQVALALARRIDGAEQESGASLAALVKEFRASLAAATAGAEVETDPIDELRAHVQRKRAAR